MPFRDSPRHEIEILMTFNFLKFLKPNKHAEDYYIRGPNDKKFLFEIEAKKYVYVGETFFNFETIDKRVKYFSEDGFNDLKFPFAYSEKTFTLCCIKNIFPFKNMKIQQEKVSMTVCVKKMNMVMNVIVVKLLVIDYL